jgi:hypothetical protein
VEEPKYHQPLTNPQGTVIGEDNTNTFNYNYIYNGGAPTSPPATSAWNIPFARNPFFLGRDELLK